MIATELTARPRELGDALRDLRRGRGLSQQELASAADVSARHLSFVENGRARPGRELLLRLADRLRAGERERDALLVAAGYAPLREEPPAGPDGFAGAGGPGGSGGSGAVVDGIGGFAPRPDALRRADVADATGLAVEAGRRALASAGAADADTVVLATATPGRPGQATAPEIADRLGLGDAAAFDIATVCGGFLYGLANAVGLVASGAAARVLLIASDTPTPPPAPPWTTVARQWRGGAGAVVLRAGAADGPGALGRVVLDTDTRRAVPAEERLYATSLRALDTVDWTARDIDRLAAHRCDPAALRALTGRLKLPAAHRLSPPRVPGAAAIPLLLTRAAADGTLTAGHRLLLTAYEADRTWAATTLNWPRLHTVPSTT
ncbi:helix-turn-helix domain-containing protein [Streptomyces griseosporeus]|uniref:helix-turn-helix domain-containing protein n=1 Tax=Streptomyces griseosporeus TaxID=1910 RepID=UPI0036F6530E